MIEGKGIFIREGRGGCGRNWLTYEIPVTVQGDAFNNAGAGSGGKRGRKKRST
jgi:hypothetical protein